MFRVSSGASEHADYAISALEEFNLQPSQIDQSVTYDVFDFGGENILNFLAYQVYKDNLNVMRENHIPFVLPPTCNPFAGSELLIFSPNSASQLAYMNSKRLSNEMRCIWEHHDDYKEKFNKPLNINLFSSTNNQPLPIDLKVNVDSLKNCIHQRIYQGVENFFTALLHAFYGKKVFPIHIFLAGNSCKSPIVSDIFNELIKKYKSTFFADDVQKDSPRFILYPPLGIVSNDNLLSTDFDRLKTGKECNDDYSIFIRKVNPDTIKYAVGNSHEVSGKIYSKKF